MTSLRGLVALVVVVTSAAACGGKSSPTSPSGSSGSATTISSVASGYLGSVVDLMAAHSVYRQTIDWTALRQNVFNKAGAAQTIPDTYPAIAFALQQLGDSKAWLSKPDGVSYIAGPPGPVCSSGTPAAPDLSAYPNVRRILLGGCNGCNAAQYATNVRDLIAHSDSSGVTGWIVDLRGNYGGNVWPMIAGIGPILGNGSAGAYVDVSGQRSIIAYQDGVASLAGAAQVTVTNPYQVYNNSPRVAIITDSSTSGGGEMVAILFRGRPNTLSFGSPSCGIPGAVSGYTLSDNSVLLLTTMLTADRNGVTYPGSVQPDVIAGDSGETVIRAAEWLQGK